MNSKNKIITDYKKKVNLVKKYNEYYFKYDNPKISDAEYDNLKKDIISLEKKFNFLKELGLFENSVGFSPSNKFKKIKHLSPMLSLSNAFDKSDMQEYLKKINNFLNFDNPNLELISEPKIDGISATLIYEKRQGED